jgi:hypothetical protein
MVVMTNRHKALLAGALAMLLLLGFWWNSLVSRVAADAQAQLLSKVNERVNGKVNVGSFDFSFYGTLTAHAVTVSDSKNAVIGKSDKVTVRFGVGDVLAGRADMSAVQSVTLENPVMTLITEKDGRWNWQNLVKSRPEEPMTFRGAVNVKNGAVQVGENGQGKLTAVSGSFDLAGYPAVALDLTAKSGSTPLAVKGNWNPGVGGELAIKTEQLALADLPLAALGAGDFKLTGGQAKNVTVTVKQKDGRFSFAGEGTLEKAATTVAGYAVSEGSGKVTLADSTVTLKDGTALLNGQKLTAVGTLTSADGGFQLSLDLAANAFDAAALGTMPLKGTIAFQTKVEGTVDQPRANGSFSIPQGSFGTVAFANGRGDFTYAGGTLTLINTQAAAWDGALAVAGTVVPASQRYQMTASGSGMDAAALTEKDIKGRVSFDANLSGQGPSGGHAEGSFRMGEGSFQGIPFLSMTGDFAKQGEKMSFSNIIVNTVGGSFRAEGFGEGSVVRLQQLGPTSSPREIVDKAITNKVSDQLKKIFPGR